MSRMAFVARATGGGNGAAPAGSPQPGRAPTSFVMPWGKHKGLTLDTVPESYLRWCLREASALTDALRAEIEKQLNLLPGSTKTAPEEEIRVLKNEMNKLRAEKTIAEERLQEMRQTLARVNLELADLKSRPRPTLVGSPKLDGLRVVLKRWYRALATRFHPDKGGTNEQACVVTEAYSSLIREIEQWERAAP